MKVSKQTHQGGQFWGHWNSKLLGTGIYTTTGPLLLGLYTTKCATGQSRRPTQSSQATLQASHLYVIYLHRRTQ